MTNGAAAGAAGGGAAAAIANAIKASGAIVKVEPADFEVILSRAENPLVVYTKGGLFTANHQYLIGYKGLVFYTKSPAELPLPPNTEFVHAKKIWLPA